MAGVIHLLDHPLSVNQLCLGLVLFVVVVPRDTGITGPVELDIQRAVEVAFRDSSDIPSGIAQQSVLNEAGMASSMNAM